MCPFASLFAAPTRNGLTRPKAVRGSGVKMVNMGEIFAHSRLNNVAMERAPLARSDRSRFLLHDGDLLFARQSLVLSGAGKCSIFLRDDEPATFESHVIRVRLNQAKANPLYYYYYFQSQEGRSAIQSIVEQGAGASGIRGTDLAAIEVRWPPIAVQRVIANILGALDDKIELNGRMNETLETITRALFKLAFVDFDPVRAKMEGGHPGLPSAISGLFPDRLIDSEFGGIPEGWSVGCLGDIASSVRRNVDPTDLGAQTPYIGLEHMPRRSIALTEWGSSEKVTSSKSGFKKGEILFGKLRPYFHKVGLAPVDGVCSTDIVVIAPERPTWAAFALAVMSSVDFVNYTDQTSTGTKMPRTSWKAMSHYRLCLPPEDIAQAFQDAAGPMLGRVVANIRSKRNLEALRNTLLSILVSGTVHMSHDGSVAAATV